jgi:hypothetical protein
MKTPLISDERCWSCFFYVAREGGKRGNGKVLKGTCKRYPLESTTTDYSWCGEYRRWKNKKCVIIDRVSKYDSARASKKSKLRF